MPGLYAFDRNRKQRHAQCDHVAARTPEISTDLAVDDGIRIQQQVVGEYAGKAEAEELEAVLLPGPGVAIELLDAHECV